MVLCKSSAASLNVRSEHPSRN